MSLYSNGKVFSEREIEELKSKSIFTATEDYVRTTGIRGDESLQELVRRFAVPPLGGEEIFEVIGKYGHSFFGICDGFAWDNLEDITELDAYKIIALCAIYWEIRNKKWYERERADNNG